MPKILSGPRRLLLPRQRRRGRILVGVARAWMRKRERREQPGATERFDSLHGTGAAERFLSGAGSDTLRPRGSDPRQ